MSEKQRTERRLCHTCQHPRRAEIELALAKRQPLRFLADKFGLSIYTLHRHRKAHMPPQLKSALLAVGKPSDIDLDALRKTESEGLLQTLVVQRGRLFGLLDQAEESGDVRATVSVHKAINDNLTSVAKLLGEISTHSTVVTNNLTISPEYLALRASLVQALRKHPEALKAIRGVLAGVETPKTIEHSNG